MTDPDRPALADAPPASSGVTPYDRAHLATYARLLDAEADGAPWSEAARVILGLDPEVDADRARAVHTAHLDRARWMSEAGYRDLLKPGSS